MPELAFFLGKGGVGKTTVSAAYAVLAARNKSAKPVLLISTDPAHSLGDVLQIRLGDEPTRVRLGAGSALYVWEMNSAALFQEFMAEHKNVLVQMIERGSFFTAQEISSLLETTLPGMSEIAALLAIQKALQLGKYSKVVVDTAPFGHTLRLFSLPEQFLRLLKFLELAGERDKLLAERFGGRTTLVRDGFLDEWRKLLKGLQKSLAESRVFLVTTAETFALNESIRCMAELRRSNPEIALSSVILNRVVKASSRCAQCRVGANRAQAARSLLRKRFRAAELRLARDPGFPIVGVQRLRQFARHVFAGSPLPKNLMPETARTPAIHLTPGNWPSLESPLSLIVGKGGVGKTTVSAGLGYRFRHSSAEAVEICSVDPAPSLRDIFETEIGSQAKPVLDDKNFRASEFDSTALFKAWVSEMRSEVDQATTADISGVHIDLSFERKLFSELLELVPPGVDEVLSVFRIVDLLGDASRKVVIDMAPTGHALELLRTPQRMLVWSRLLLKSLASHRKLALAREAAAKIAELEVRARELSRLFRSSKAASVYLVMLPELLPDRESERLLRQLDGLELATEAIFVNRVMLPDKAGACRWCRVKAAWQAEIVAKLKRQFQGREIYVIPNFESEIAGRKGLKRLTKELWRLS